MYIQNYLHPPGLQDLIIQQADFAISLEHSKQINAQKLVGLEEKIKSEGVKYFTHTLIAGTITALSVATLFYGSSLQEMISGLTKIGPEYDSIGLVTYGLKTTEYIVDKLRYLAPIGTLAGGIHTLQSIYLLLAVFNVDWKTTEALKEFGPKSEKVRN